jgi:hypothetical protein
MIIIWTLVELQDPFFGSASPLPYVRRSHDDSVKNVNAKFTKDTN